MYLHSRSGVFTSQPCTNFKDIKGAIRKHKKSQVHHDQDAVNFLAGGLKSSVPLEYWLGVWSRQQIL
jgi:hypothetical protein